jgi:hypothetical protein
MHNNRGELRVLQIIPPVKSEGSQAPKRHALLTACAGPVLGLCHQQIFDTRKG